MIIPSQTLKKLQFVTGKQGIGGNKYTTKAAIADGVGITRQYLQYCLKEKDIADKHLDALIDTVNRLYKEAKRKEQLRQRKSKAA